MFKIFLLVLYLKIFNINCQSYSRSTPSIQRDLIIVFDSTRSMEADLEAMRHTAKLVVKEFEQMKTNPITNFIIELFNDPDLGQAFKTRDKNELFRKLDTIQLDSTHNRDCPELCFSGIEIAIQNASTESYVFVFTDAPTKYPEKN